MQIKEVTTIDHMCEQATEAGGTNNVHSLSCFFSPSSVAVIGATDREGSVGRTVFQNLTGGAYNGRVYAVNPARSEVFGRTCVASIAAIPEVVDLGVIVTPAATVPALVAECVKAGVPAVVVISAGFKEKGAEGAALESAVQKRLSGSHTRLIGPNCLGVMSPWLGLNATFAQDIARPGKVAFLSQSGALLTAILDWSLAAEVGFSAIVSTGSMLDVGWGDLLSYFGQDEKTESILIYMESIGAARSFLSAAREVAFSKPIIVIKAGRSEAAAKAAASHTGALTGSDEVYDAAFRRCGVLRVESISELFHMAEVLGKQPRPRGPRLTILTNAGGPGVLATDALAKGPAELAALSTASEQALSSFLPAHWSHANPIDILGDADPVRFARASDIALKDPNSDGLLVILAPQGMTDPAAVAERLKGHAQQHGKPLLASWMGGPAVAKGAGILSAAGIPVFAYPDAAVRAFQSMWSYTKHLRGLYETPSSADDPMMVTDRKQEAAKLIAKAAAAGRVLLTELESKEILRLYGIPTVPTVFAESEDGAAQHAREMGFPVVLKLHSDSITHKTDVGGVRLNLTDEDAVRKAYRDIACSVVGSCGADAFLGVTVQPMVRTEGYELILGSSIDPQFGPVILFGSGGQLVEIYRDRALAIPPMNSTLAERMMERTKIYSALKGVRGRKAVDLAALETIIVRFGELAVEQPRLREIDINPLLAAPAQSVALDARMVLWENKIQDADLPRPAIRPYPAQYTWRWVMQDGGEVTIRPIRPEDEPEMVAFHEMLSDRSVYLRYFEVEKLDSRVAHERLIRKCAVDYDREIALVAESSTEPDGHAKILGVGRLKKRLPDGAAELGILVADRYQGSGLGGELLSRLIEVARKEQISRVTARILPGNPQMQALAERFQFEPTTNGRVDIQRVILDLSAKSCR